MPRKWVSTSSLLYTTHYFPLYITRKGALLNRLPLDQLATNFTSCIYVRFINVLKVVCH
jgi:hypothetical protein